MNYLFVTVFFIENKINCCFYNFSWEFFTWCYVECLFALLDVLSPFILLTALEG